MFETAYLDPRPFWKRAGGALGRLASELELGLIALDDSGEVVESNVAARRFLDGRDAELLRAALKRAVQTAAVRADPVESLVSSPLRGDLRLLVSRSDGEGPWVGAIEPVGTRRLHAELDVLSSLLSGVAAEPGSLQTADAFLGTLARVMPQHRWAVHAVDPGSGELACIARVGFDSEEPHPSPTARMAAEHGHPVHLPRVAPDDGAAAKPGRWSVLAFPIRQSEEIVGVLEVIGPTEVFADHDFRLVRAVVDALAAVIRRSRDEARSRRLEAARRELAATRSGLERQLEQMRERSASNEPLAVLGRLLAGVAHELNNPLAYVNNNVTFARRTVDGLTRAGPAERDQLLEELKSSLDDTMEGLHRVGLLVKAIKDASRREDGTRPVDAGASIRAAVTLFSGAKKHESRVDLILPPLPLVRANEAALVQVLMNLLENGFDAMGGQGHLEVRAAPDGAGVRIDVLDEGPGVPAGIGTRIYEPFFTTKAAHGGTGLGLYLCNDLIRRMGGRIEHGAEAGRTCFSVWVPAACETDN